MRANVMRTVVSASHRSLRACVFGFVLGATIATAHAHPMFGTTDANLLVRFDDATPGVIVSSVSITGLQPGEILYGIDFRPNNESLYGLGSSSRLYRIDLTTGAATQIGSPFVIPLNGTSFGFDFNPTVDRVRIVSDADQNLRLNPNDAAVTDLDSTTPGTQPDANLNYALGDPNAGQNPNVVGSAYSNNLAEAQTTTLFGIDSGRDVLVTQNPPNIGTLNTTGDLGVDTTAVVGFDIVGASTARAAMVTGGVLRLYSISLPTGAATLIGTIAAPIRTLAASPLGFICSLSGTTAQFSAGTGPQTLVFDSAGGLLRHNRFSVGNPGFNSDFDFDSTTPGDQTLSASDPTPLVIVNAGNGDDRIVIGSATSPASGLLTMFDVRGDAGHDVIEIDDAASAVGRTVTLGVGPVTGLSGPITRTTVETLVVSAGSGDDVFNLGNPLATTSILANGGDDTIVFGDGGSLADGLLDGGSGFDVVDYAEYTSDVAFNLATNRTLFLARASTSQAPPFPNPSGASGNGLFLLDAAQTELTFSLRYRGITIAGATITGAHFHQAPPGLNGTIVRDVTTPEQNGAVLPAGTFTGIWRNTDTQALTPSLVSSLMSNGLYLDLHTSLSGGEIRGQLISQGAVGTATGTGGIRGIELVDLALFANGFE